MNTMKLALLSLSVLAAPAAAQSLSDTHEMRWAPAGKVPMVTYHPLKRCVQAPSQVHLSGKTQYMAPARSADCNKRIAVATAGNDQSRATRD